MRTGRSGVRLHAVMSLVAVLGIGLSPASEAFFPSGSFKQFENTPVLLRWGMENLDVTGDGTVDNPEDGILVTIDIGDDGFTAAEVQAIRNAFQVWQDVPGSFIAYRFQEIEGPFPVASGDQLGTVNDPFNSVSLGTTGALVSDTFTSFVIDEGLITDPVTGVQFLVRGPKILESDIIVSEAFFRPEEAITPDPGDPTSLVPRNATTLREVLPLAIGVFNGLSFTPLNNAREEEINIGLEESVTVLLEDAVMPYRGADGIVRRIGATPTMYNAIVVTEAQDGETTSIHLADLAHDDIAGIMYMYPRLEQRDDLFTIAQEARSGARPGFTTSPIVGGHVIAWVDQDRDSTTTRVPLISTMSGLYVNEQPIGEVSGRFQLLGLFKRLIDDSGNLFSPDYVLTISPMTDFPPVAMDSMHNTSPTTTRSPDVYNTLFPFEVYNEAGNLFNRANMRFGTPLYFDTVRRQVVSRTSGLTLSQQLPRNTPMFGQEGDVCFFDLIGDPGTGGVQQPPGIAALPGIRAFRDNVMLRSRVGAAATDAYYRMTPAVASFLVAHQTILSAARSAFAVLLWLTVIPLAVWGGMAAALTLWLGRRHLRKRAAFRAASAATAALLLLVGGVAQAATTFDTPEQMIQKSDAIIAGEVTAVHSYYSTDMLPATIVTDVSVAVSATYKGGLNKGSTVTIRVPGGQVGAHVVRSAAQPTFTEGQEVLLLVSVQQKDIGLTLPYGKIGTMLIEKDPDTGEVAVKGGSVAGGNYMRQIARSVNAAALKRGVLKSAAEAEPGQFSLESFGAFVQEAESKARN